MEVKKLSKGEYFSTQNMISKKKDIHYTVTVSRYTSMCTLYSITHD